MRTARTPVRRAVVVAALVVAGIGVPTAAAAPLPAGTTKASASLTGPTSGVYGSQVTMSGRLWRTGTSTNLANATVWLQRTTHNGSSWSNVTSTRSSSAGTFSFTVTQGTPYDYRAYWGGSATYTAAVSPKTFPAVLQSVRFDTIRDLNWTLGTLEATATLLPVQVSGGTVWLQRYNATTKVWQNYISARTTGHSKVTIRANVNGTSAWFRIYAPSRGVYSGNYSTTKQFNHYKWRGAYAKPLVGAPGGTNDPYFFIASESTRKTATLSADKNGSVYGDLNTSGCSRLTNKAVNNANAAANVGVGSQSFSLAAGATRTTNLTMNAATTRLQVADTTSTQGPILYTETQLLCSN